MIPPDKIEKEYKKKRKEKKEEEISAAG